MAGVALIKMRCALFLVMLALLLGAAPALAQEQESPSILQLFKPSDAGPAKKHVKRKAAPAKANVAKPADTEPVEAKQAQPKPANAKAAGASHAAGKPHAVKNATAERKAANEKIVTARPEPDKSEPVKSEQFKAGDAADVLAGIPRDERLKIQAALLWSGDYTGAAGGEDAMLTAVKNYQKRNKAKITGVLTPDERAALVAAARAQEDEFGWSVVIDPATGIRIGLPAKLVPHAHEAARGTRWSSPHGEVQVETFRIKNPALKLAALFEQQKKEPVTRKVATSVLHDDNFFISGIEGLKKFSVRARLRGGEVRGVTVLYDQAMEGIVAPAMLPMANAFSPFPERGAPYAALTRSVEYGNGLVVSTQGHIVTDRKLTEGCKVIVAAGLGDADRLASDRQNGLALLRVYGPRKMSALALSRASPKSSANSGELTLLGLPDPKEQDGSRHPTEIKARLAGGTAIELRQPVPMAGLSGAAALDEQGRFLGMIEIGTAVLASIEPAAPPVRLVTAETIRGFLAAHQVTPAAAPSGDARASVVRVICVRK
jgi:hypothetical protein